ncbi:MAG: cob(I)yrinic acid a,c-diamide adenosyltransferase [Pseudomonadales bacterium]|nr:cob(I)yrinic acid a,c-diamide adenosyltransferase [Pseudomonadales bacterium]
MGYRLSKIYTRTGDDGTTGLADGSRVPKDDMRMEVLGCIDELSSAVGMVRCELATSHELSPVLRDIQQQLLNLGGDLAMPGMLLLAETVTLELEQGMDRMNETLAPLREFILPGGNRAAAACHLARSIARRTERRMVSLNREHSLPPRLMRYINRLSDWLFVASRQLVSQEGGQEIQWDRSNG